MKKLVTLIAILFVGFMLVACQDKAGEVTATMTGLDVELTSMTFTIEISDPEEEITGAVTLTLYDDEDKVAHTKDISDFAELVDYQISGLKNEVVYTLNVFATIGRNVVTLIDREINLASAETVHITTPAEFLDMVNNRAGNYVLDNDIDFQGTTFSSPFSSPFSGTFDGQGFALKNITFDKVLQYTGVFGYVSSGSIKNVTFDNVTIGTEAEPLEMTTSSRVGIVAGYIASTTATIENVSVINSSIYYQTSSTVQAYVGGLVGESRGLVQSASLDNTVVSVKSTSYGRIRVGGAVGLLGEDAKLKDIDSAADVLVNIAGASLKDRNLNINVGGVIGYHNARNINLSVENLVSSGDVTIDLNFGTAEGTTDASYAVYVGGIAGIAYSNVNQALYSGSITLNHEKNDFEAEVNKSFFVGGLYGAYITSKDSLGNLRYSDQAVITVHVSDDVNLRASQLIANLSSSGENVFSYFGDLGLMINDVDETANDLIDVILSTDEFFNSEFINTWLSQAE
jgi:hypothetical protein